MAGVYVFNYNDVDLDTTGLVGDLQPIECTFYEEKNGESNLTLRLCYDELNKWAAVKVGSYIKAQVPVRVPPKITNNAYDKQIMTWKVKTSLTKEATVWQSSGKFFPSMSFPEEKALFYLNDVGIGKEVKVKKRLKSGHEVQVLEQHSDGRVKVYSEGFGTGWTVVDNLEQVVSNTIPATFNGVESVVTPTRLQYQLFQVTSVEQTLDSVSVTAQHVFYELLHTVTNYKADYPLEAFNAINGVFDGMLTQDERFTCLTDASHKAGALDYERVNMVQALLDPENGICAQYGLSLIRDNYDLYALKNVGSDRGFVVEYGKNMLSVERIEDISNVVTRIIPFGKDKKGNLVYMDSCIYIDSAHIDEYAFPRMMYLDCSDTATESDKMTLAQVKAELKARAEAEFAAGCDLPELTMTVDFISLGDTEEYKQYRDLDKVYLFDKITVKDKVRGYDYNAEVVAVTHNVLTGQLESVTLGSIQKGTGIRKIATWQVPEVDGANIRLQSIAAGVLAGGAVVEDNLQDDSVTADKIKAKAIQTEHLDAESVTAEKIKSKTITAEQIDANFAAIDFIKSGEIKTEHLYSKSITTDKIATGAITAESGIIAKSAIGTTQIRDGSITSAKIVSLNADVINTGTLSADRLLLKGDDGIYYKINASSSGLTQSELTDEKYKNYIDGSVLVAKSVTTDQLAAASVTANEILSGAITTDKLAANAVTANKIQAGAITTNKIASEVGQNLDLSSNKSIRAIVAAVPKTYVRFDKPSGSEYNIGDVWIKTVNNRKWEDLKAEKPNGLTVSWDGEMDGHTVVGGIYVHVSDTEVSAADCESGVIVSRRGSDGMTLDIMCSFGNGGIVQENGAIVCRVDDMAVAYLVQTAGFAVNGTALPEKGIYIASLQGVPVVTGISIRGYVHGEEGLWSGAKKISWGEWATSEQPKTYVWDGVKWQLTVDYDLVRENQTAITQTQKEISLKASSKTLQDVSGRVAINSTEIKQNANAILLKATADDPATYVKTSTVTISPDGVAIKTGGTFTVDSQKFDIDENGEMSAVNARISGQLSVNGNDVWHKGNMVVSTEQPDNVPPGTIWIKPDQSAIPAAGTWSHAALTLRPWSNNYVVELNGTSIGEAPSGATYTYEVSVPVYYAYKKTDTCTCTVYLGATSGAKTISMGAQSFGANNAGGNTYKATVTSKTWLGNSGKIYMLVSFSNGNLMTVDSHSAFACTLMAKSASAEGWKACEVQMYVG